MISKLINLISVSVYTIQPNQKRLSLQMLNLKPKTLSAKSMMHGRQVWQTSLKLQYCKYLIFEWI